MGPGARKFPNKMPSYLRLEICFSVVLLTTFFLFCGPTQIMCRHSPCWGAGEEQWRAGSSPHTGLYWGTMLLPCGLYSPLPFFHEIYTLHPMTVCPVWIHSSHMKYGADFSEGI